MKIIHLTSYNLPNKIGKTKKLGLALIALLAFGYGTPVLAQTSSSVLYVPLIGLTSVPNPLALPNGPGNVTYNYAVKNFLAEVPLTNIQVTDNQCGSVKYVTGDDNNDLMLEYSETWRYACTTKLSKTTQSIATATGTAHDITASHKAYATVVVGSDTTPPLVSIINITKVAYPLSLPAEGGQITYTYKVSNPGVVPLSQVNVTDDKCKNMSGKLGDTNGNSLLDINEVWIYTCTTTLTQTTTNTAHVVAFANGLQAVDNVTLTVIVDNPIPGLPDQSIPSFPETGNQVMDLKTGVWGILAGILLLLGIIYILVRKGKAT